MENKYIDILSEAKFIDNDIKQPEPIITINGKTIATEGNFITINGLPKSRKTTFSFFFLASALRKKNVFGIDVKLNDNEKALFIDTEQSVYDFSRQIKTLKFLIKCKKLPSNFDAYLFRKYEPGDILETTYELIKEQRPKIVFLDNLTELVTNPNDMIESKKVIQWLKRITSEFNCVIVCLLHLSKNNLQSLGNLGSYADRGAQSALKVTLDKETQTSTLEASLMRSDGFFEPITVFYNEDTKSYDLTETAPPKSKKRFVLMDLTDTDHYNRLGVVFNNRKDIVYNEIIEELKNIYGVGTNIAKQQILPYLLGNKFLRSEKGIYNLNN